MPVGMKSCMTTSSRPSSPTSARSIVTFQRRRSLALISVPFFIPRPPVLRRDLDQLLAAASGHERQSARRRRWRGGVTSSSSGAVNSRCCPALDNVFYDFRQRKNPVSDQFCPIWRRLSRDVRQLGAGGAQIHLGSPGESGKWGRSSPTDQGRVSPSQALNLNSIRSPPEEAELLPAADVVPSSLLDDRRRFTLPPGDSFVS
jgi:hypothetical protein